MFERKRPSAASHQQWMSLHRALTAFNKSHPMHVLRASRGKPLAAILVVLGHKSISNAETQHRVEHEACKSDAYMRRMFFSGVRYVHSLQHTYTGWTGSLHITCRPLSPQVAHQLAACHTIDSRFEVHAVMRLWEAGPGWEGTHLSVTHTCKLHCLSTEHILPFVIMAKSPSAMGPLLLLLLAALLLAVAPPAQAVSCQLQPVCLSSWFGHATAHIFCRLLHMTANSRPRGNEVVRCHAWYDACQYMGQVPIMPLQIGEHCTTNAQCKVTPGKSSTAAPCTALESRCIAQTVQHWWSLGSVMSSAGMHSV